MTDYRTMFDKEHIGAWDLGGRDVTVEIESVKAGKVGHGNKATKKPILRFRGKSKSLACNATNAKTIAQLYGNDTRAWIGKRVTLYPTVTTFGSDTVDCVRIRPRVPGEAPRSEDFAEPDPAVKAAMIERQNRATGREDMSDDERRAALERKENPNA